MVLFHPYCPRDYFQICSLLLSKQPLMYIIWTQLSVHLVFGHNIQLRDTCLKDANVKIHILCCLFSISNTNSKNSTCDMSLRSNHTVWTASGTDRRPNHERAPWRSLQERNQTHLSKLEVGVEWVECLCLCVCVCTPLIPTIFSLSSGEVALLQTQTNQADVLSVSHHNPVLNSVNCFAHFLFDSESATFTAWFYPNATSTDVTEYIPVCCDKKN